jgi:hypothetical protein
LEEFIDETGHGVGVELRFFDPDVVRGKGRFLWGFQEVEVGQEDAVGKNVLDVLLDQNRSCRNGIDKPRFVETLPDVAWASAMDGGLAVAPNIYIYKVALTDFEGLLFDGEIRDKVRAEGRAGFL